MHMILHDENTELASTSLVIRQHGKTFRQELVTLGSRNGLGYFAPPPAFSAAAFWPTVTNG